MSSEIKIGTTGGEAGSGNRTLLLPGRWLGVTKDQETSMRVSIGEVCKGIAEGNAVKLVFVITASDKGGTKRYPLALAERKEVLEGLAKSLGHAYEIHAVPDIADSSKWVEHMKTIVSEESGGKTVIDPSHTIVVSSNPEVLELFAAHGYASQVPNSDGSMPVDLLAAIATGASWREMATEGTVAVFDAHGLEARISEIFHDVLLNEDGELSTGRDYAVYSAGMDASMHVKEDDIFPHVLPGKIVDKGCGTGSLLVRLSEQFPDSEIVGMDLSRQLLMQSERKFFPNHNVAVVKGNIIENRFKAGSLSTVIFSSVMHEIYSYNGYDRDQVRKALANTRLELRTGGRIIIRDGIKPASLKKGSTSESASSAAPQGIMTPNLGKPKVEPGCEADMIWMRCADAETEERFRLFAREFKGKSNHPGVAFTEQSLPDSSGANVTWFHTSLHEANEFLSKKDYIANWAMEVNEEFGVFTLEEWKRELEDQGYRVIELKSYLNPWIAENRYDKHVWLHADDGGKPGAALPYPDTTAVIVAEAVNY